MHCSRKVMCIYISPVELAFHSDVEASGKTGLARRSKLEYECLSEHILIFRFATDLKRWCRWMRLKEKWMLWAIMCSSIQILVSEHWQQKVHFATTTNLTLWYKSTIFAKKEVRTFLSHTERWTTRLDHCIGWQFDFSLHYWQQLNPPMISYTKHMWEQSTRPEAFVLFCASQSVSPLVKWWKGCLSTKSCYGGFSLSCPINKVQKSPHQIKVALDTIWNEISK